MTKITIVKRSDSYKFDFFLFIYQIRKDTAIFKGRYGHAVLEKGEEIYIYGVLHFI